MRLWWKIIPQFGSFIPEWFQTKCGRLNTLQWRHHGHNFLACFFLTGVKRRWACGHECFGVKTPKTNLALSLFVVHYGTYSEQVVDTCILCYINSLLSNDTSMRQWTCHHWFRYIGVSPIRPFYGPQMDRIFNWPHNQFNESWMNESILDQ